MSTKTEKTDNNKKAKEGNETKEIVIYYQSLEDGSIHEASP
jgi:hypothetical protein